MFMEQEIEIYLWIVRAYGFYSRVVKYKTNERGFASDSQFYDTKERVNTKYYPWRFLLIIMLYIVLTFIMIQVHYSGNRHSQLVIGRTIFLLRV